MDADPGATRTLDSLQPGEEAVVEGFLGDASNMKRLREMGLVAGTRVKFLRWAPLGDPLEILLRGYRLSLRKQDAAHVSVRAMTP